MKKEIEHKAAQQKKLEGHFADHKDHLERVKIADQKYQETVTKVKEYFMENIKNVRMTM
jgi:hypothetical protein